MASSPNAAPPFRRSIKPCAFAIAACGVFASSPLRLVRFCSATGVMTTLESRGFATRSKDRRDGRMVIVRLTAPGRTKIEELFPRFNAEESTVAAHLDPRQQDELAAMLRSLLRAVAPPPPDGSAEFP